MFYKKGIDITNDKQMFNFLKEHFTYYTGHSWNLGGSIANNVKLYKLNLSGDWTVAMNLLETDDYHSINNMILLWENEHEGYKVGFNGRSGGYLVLYENKRPMSSILPDEIDNCEDYEEYKRYCKDYYGSVKANRSDLRFYTQLVQDFDKLCDELRDFCDKLSKEKFEVVEMEKAVEDFNSIYEDDLEYLGFDELDCDGNGFVDVSEIRALDCLMAAFAKVACRKDNGYLLKINENKCYYEKAF